MTLRTRFALWVAGLLLAGMAAFGAFVYYSMARGLAASIDDALLLGAQQVQTTIDIENGQIEVDPILTQSDNIQRLRERGLKWQILDSDLQVRAAFSANPILPTKSSVWESPQGGSTHFSTLTDTVEGYPVRVYTATILDGDHVAGYIQVAQSLEELHAALQRLLVSLLVSAPLLALAAGLGGYFLAGRALAPIDRITHTVRRISIEDLSARIELPGIHDEVGRLANTFDEMLERLENSLRRERQFTADAAHELRTPLAGMQAILSVIGEKKRTAEEYELALADLSEETDRLRTLAENLLMLARGDFQHSAAAEAIDLKTLLSDVCDALRPLAEAKGISLICEAPAGITMRANQDGMIRLVLNLVDNAIKYTADGEVTVTGKDEGEALVMEIADTGPGIPPEHLAHIFDRFYRVDASRSTSGSGLGLTIAAEIAHAQGGNIEVSSQVGIGTTFRVTLPRSR